MFDLPWRRDDRDAARAPASDFWSVLATLIVVSALLLALRYSVW